MNLTNLLEKRNAIYGACALWIILFHVFRRISMPYIPVLTNIIGIGNLGVDVFFFLSGLCLCLSAEKHQYIEKGWKGFFKRRLERVLIPYLIVGIPYYLWNCICEVHGGVGKRILVFLANLSSATFWLRGTQTTWYVYGIILFYCLFPFLFRFIKRKSRIETIGLLIGMIVFSIISAYTPILKNSLVVWARLPVFTMGIWAVEEFDGKQYIFSKIGQITALALLLLLGTVTSISELSPILQLPSVLRFLLYLPMTLSLMGLLSANPMKAKPKVLEWLGGLSLELYLVHVTLLHPIKYYGIMDAVGNWLYLILPLLSALIAWVVEKIEKTVMKRLA